MNILGINPDTLYSEFITNSEVKDNIKLSKKINSLSKEKKLFVSSIIDLLNDL